MVGKSNIEKLTEAIFPWKFIFAQIWAKRAQNGPKIRVLGFFEIFCNIRFSWKWSNMKTNTIIDISPTHPPKFWVSSCQPIKLQEVNDEVYSLYADKHGGHLQGDTIILGECNQTCPKYPKVCISLEYLHNCMGDEIDFLPADKHNICL